MNTDLAAAHWQFERAAVALIKVWVETDLKQLLEANALEAGSRLAVTFAIGRPAETTLSAIHSDGASTPLLTLARDIVADREH
jgi:hypothetical protein